MIGRAGRKDIYARLTVIDRTTTTKRVHGYESNNTAIVDKIESRRNGIDIWTK